MSLCENSREVEVVRHFNRQARSWEQKLQFTGSMAERPQQFVELLREHVSRGGRVLDFGCGSGDITVALKSAGFDVCGVDCSSGMINQARERFASIGIPFDSLQIARQDILPYESGSFDAVVASSVLEYVRQPEETLRELCRICRDDGVLIMTFPNMRTPRRWMEAVVRPLSKMAIHSGVTRLSMYGEYLRLSKNRLSARGWSDALSSAGWIPSMITHGRRPLMVVVARVAGT